MFPHPRHAAIRAALVIASILIIAPAALAGPKVHVVTVGSPPPPSAPIIVQSAPGPDYRWVDGRYDWVAGNWTWIPGHWERVPQPIVVARPYKVPVMKPVYVNKKPRHHKVKVHKPKRSHHVVVRH